MYIFLIVIHVLASLVLIAVILLQAGRGGGLAETFGGGAAQNIFGTSASKILTKATTVCAVTFILTSIALGVLSSRKSQSLMKQVSPVTPVTATTPAETKGAIPTAKTQKIPKNGPIVPESTGAIDTVSPAAADENFADPAE